MTSNERDLSGPIKKALNINNNDYKIVGNEAGGDCFFASVRDAFKDNKKYQNITVSTLRERLANDLSQKEYDDQKSDAEVIGNEGETKDIIESKNLEDFKQKIVSKEFWANHWAINKIEKLYNIKFIIIKEPENGNIFQCTDQNLNNNPVYILLYFSGRDEGAHYELIKYKVKSYFNSLNEISEIKNKYINICGTPEQKQALKQAKVAAPVVAAPVVAAPVVAAPAVAAPAVAAPVVAAPAVAAPVPKPNPVSVVDKVKEAKEKEAKEEAAKKAKSLAKISQPDVPVDTKLQISSEDNIPSKDDIEKLQKKKEQAKELINIAKKAKEMAEKNNNLSEEAVKNLQKAKQDLQDAKSAYTFIDKELSKKNGIYLMNNKNIQKDEEIKDEEIKDEEIKKMQEKEEQIEQLEEKEENNNDFLVINLSIIGIIVFGAFQFLKN